MFGEENNFMGNLGNDLPQDFDETFLLAIAKLGNPMNRTAFYTVVRGRKDLAKLLSQLPTNIYAIAKMEIINSFKDYKSLLTELATENKPNDMEFGKE